MARSLSLSLRVRNVPGVCGVLLIFLQNISLMHCCVSLSLWATPFLHMLSLLDVWQTFQLASYSVFATIFPPCDCQSLRLRNPLIRAVFACFRAASLTGFCILSYAVIWHHSDTIHAYTSKTLFWTFKIDTFFFLPAYPNITNAQK